MHRVIGIALLVLGLSTVARAGEAVANPEALKLALDSIPSIGDDRKEARALLAIGEALAAVGEKAQAATVLRQASASAKLLSDETLRFYYLDAIISAQCTAGDFAGALGNASLLEKGRGHAKILTHIGAAQAAAGDLSGSRATFAQAVGSVNAIDSARGRAWVLADIAVEQADTGDREGTAETLKMALIFASPDDGKPASVFALAGIAASETKLGNRLVAVEILSQATAAADADNDPDSCCYDFLEIARVESGIGDQSAAKKTLELALTRTQAITDYEELSQRLAFIADSLRTAGAKADAAKVFEDARVAASSIADAKKRDSRLRQVAAIQAGVELGSFTTAFNTGMAIALSSLDGSPLAPSEDVNALREVPADDRAAAIATANDIQDPSRRFSTIMAIAAPSLAAGDIDALPGLIAEGMKAVRDLEARGAGLSYIQVHDMALLSIVAGNIEWPLQMGRALAQGKSPPYMLAYVSWAQAEMGDFAAAKSSLREISENTDPYDPFSPYLFLRLLALAQANAGDMKAAMTILESVDDESFRVNALIAIAFDRPPSAFWTQVDADMLDYP